MLLQDKVALVTGGNSGIGRGIVHRFLRVAAPALAVGSNQPGPATTGRCYCCQNHASRCRQQLARCREIAR